MMKGRKITLCLVAAGLLAVGVGGWKLHRDASKIYDQTIRLHILAASDSERDQSLKLTVRDALLDEVAKITEKAPDKEAGESILRENIPYLTEIAKETLEREGCNEDVKITLTREYYPTRDYDHLRLPEGEYTSLQVKIGAAEGKNWWCILFPPVCTSSARAEEAMAETGFSKSQIRLLTEDEDPRYTLKFRVVEQFSKIKRSLKELFR